MIKPQNLMINPVTPPGHFRVRRGPATLLFRGQRLPLCRGLSADHGLVEALKT